MSNTLWSRWPHTTPARNYTEATDEEILAQPCVVEALRKAQEGCARALDLAREIVDTAVRLARTEGFAAGRDEQHAHWLTAPERTAAEVAARPDLAGRRVRYVHTAVFEGPFEMVAAQRVRSLPAGRAWGVVTVLEGAYDVLP